jgi:AcrR family transcriptional regulator
VNRAAIARKPPTNAGKRTAAVAPRAGRRRRARVSGPRRAPTGSAAIGLRKAPRQQRSRAVVADILEAAALTFAELGYARATTNRIAERAGVSVGSLYQYFDGKDALLARLLADHHEQVHAVVAPALVRLADPARPLDGTIRTLFRELVAVHTAHPTIARALSESVLRQSATLGGGRPDEHETAQFDATVAALAARGDVRRGDHRVMAALLTNISTQLSRWLVHDAPEALDRAVMLEETVQLIVRYLSAPAGAGRDRGARAHPGGVR